MAAAVHVAQMPAKSVQGSVPRIVTFYYMDYLYYNSNVIHALDVLNRPAWPCACFLRARQVTEVYLKLKHAFPVGATALLGTQMASTVAPMPPPMIWQCLGSSGILHASPHSYME